MSLFESVPFPDGPQSVAVIGAGSFGTAMAQVVAKCGHFARIYARKEEVVTSINENHINPHYLSEFTLSDKITATSNLEEALDGVSFAILAIPTQLVCLYGFVVMYVLIIY